MKGAASFQAVSEGVSEGGRCTARSLFNAGRPKSYCDVLFEVRGKERTLSVKLLNMMILVCVTSYDEEKQKLLITQAELCALGGFNLIRGAEAGTTSRDWNQTKRAKETLLQLKSIHSNKHSRGNKQTIKKIK